MCVCPVLAPHGRPAPPAPATRPSHHQSKPHIHSRRDARAAAHLTSTTSPFCALCRLCTLLQASHKRLYQDAPRYDADSAPRKARTHARSRTRAHPLSLLHSLSACLHTQHTAPSARVLRTAPLPPRACLHCTRRARGTLRARTPARARARAQPLSAAQTASLPAHTAYSTMGTHTPNDAARTPQQ